MPVPAKVTLPPAPLIVRALPEAICWSCVNVTAALFTTKAFGMTVMPAAEPKVSVPALTMVEPPKVLLTVGDNVVVPPRPFTRVTTPAPLLTICAEIVMPLLSRT